MIHRMIFLSLALILVEHRACIALTNPLTVASTRSTLGRSPILTSLSLAEKPDSSSSSPESSNDDNSPAINSNSDDASVGTNGDDGFSEARKLNRIYGQSAKDSLEKIEEQGKHIIMENEKEAGSLLGMQKNLLFESFSDSEQSLADKANKARLFSTRGYARQNAFAKENLTAIPNIDDLSFPPDKSLGNFWVTVGSKVLAFVACYALFPFLIQFMNGYVTMAPEKLFDTANTFGPGISILYGTFVSLTVDILYDNQRQIQERAVTECSLLTFTLRNVLLLFKNSSTDAINAAQCIADQIRTLVKSSRGTELMQIMYSDPYAKLHAIIDDFEETLVEDGQWDYQMNRLVTCRDLVLDLQRIRAERLSEEGVWFPPTHFTVLNLLTALTLLSYCIAILPTVDSNGFPSNESSILFAVLASLFLFFEQFIDDLSTPFEGVYQIRRSSTASHLLQAKLLIGNHPLISGKVYLNVADKNENDRDNNNSNDKGAKKSSSSTVKDNSRGYGDIRFDVSKSRSSSFPRNSNSTAATQTP